MPIEENIEIKVLEMIVHRKDTLTETIEMTKNTSINPKNIPEKVRTTEGNSKNLSS